MAKIALSTAIDSDTYNRLQAHADATGESKISIIERALTVWLDDHETTN